MSAAASGVLLVAPNLREPDETGPPDLPVGLGYVARSLAAAGIPCEVSDLALESEDDLERRIQRFRPRFLGIRLLSYRCGESYELLMRLRERHPGLGIIAGGPHLTADGGAVLADCVAIDLGVVGEGEETLRELVCGSAPATVPGVFYRADGEVRFSGPRPFIADLDAVPFPDYEGFALDKYSHVIPIASSRGCPYQCIFCGAPRILGRKWRRRSAAGMLGEIAFWRERGRREFVFRDSNFAIDKGRVREFCREVVARGWQLSLSAEGVRADHLDRSLLEQMRAAGFECIALGVESASDRVLAALKKGETRRQIETAIADATALGFRTNLFFIVGSPGETPADVEESFRLAEKYPVETVHFFAMTPIPGTEFHEWAAAHGYAARDGGRYTRGKFGREEELSFTPDGMTPEEAKRLLRRARGIEERVSARARRRDLIRRVVRNLAPARGLPALYRRLQAWRRSS